MPCWSVVMGAGIVCPLLKKAEGSQGILYALLIMEQKFQVKLGNCGLSVGSWANDLFVLFLLPFMEANSNSISGDCCKD